MDIPEWVKRIVRKHKGLDVRFIANKELTTSDLDPQQHRFLIPRESVASRIVPALRRARERRDAGLPADDGNGRGPHPPTVRSSSGEKQAENLCRSVLLLQLISASGCGSSAAVFPDALALVPFVPVEAAPSSSSSGNSLAIVPFVPDVADPSTSSSTVLKKCRNHVRKKAAPVILPGVPVTVYTKAGWRFGPMTLKRWESSGGTIINGREWNLFYKISEFKPGTKVQVWSFRTFPTDELNIIIGEVDLDQP